MRPAKTTLLGTTLVALALWPLVHLWLVARFDVNPWKLAGWGMYSVPRSRSLGMEIFGRDAAGGDLVHLGAPSPAMRDDAARYLERHRWLRKLVRPDALAAAVAAAHPDWVEIDVVVFEPELERASGMMVMGALVHGYRRADGAAPLVYAGEQDPRAIGLPPALLAQLPPAQ